jgi:peptidoglycan hydrolase-like protein with peptidoglycan-binding domain
MRRLYSAIAAGLAATGAVGCLAGCGTPASHSTPPTVPVSTAPVIRTNVAQRQEVNGSLAYEGSYGIIASGAGTLTWLPAAGQIIWRGQAAYEVNGTPVRLMYGSRPVWRAFELGMTDGQDVWELNRNLAVLGYGKGLDLVVDDHFSLATYDAVYRWQEAMGLPVTGTVPLGQLVFAPAAVRVSGSSLTVGSQVQAGQQVAYGTGTQRAVLIQLDPATLPKVHEGDPVTVTLPDGSIHTATVSSVGSVAVSQSGSPGSGSSSGASGSSQTVPVTVTVNGSLSGWLDAAQVQVGIISQEDKNVLAVPTVALLAAPGGTYQVIVVNGTAQHRVTVQPGLFDENTGLTEVTGDLSPGQSVEVPSGSS